MKIIMVHIVLFSLCCFVSSSFFLLTGMQIIYSLDEVSFIQNLIFYIEAAYKIPVSAQLFCLTMQVYMCFRTTVFGREETNLILDRLN